LARPDLDRPAAERAVRDFLRALGQDPDGDATLKETPQRMTEAFATDLLAGYAVDLDSLFADGSEANGGGQAEVVALTGISVTTVCPHHLMPALGRATVAYLPGSRLLGIGTISRLVDAFARRLTLQEKIGEQVVEALIGKGGALGAYCELRLSHTCLSARGARQTEAELITVAKAGAFSDPARLGELRLALGRAPT
jgi:GTP cyclohydrolase I